MGDFRRGSTFVLRPNQTTIVSVRAISGTVLRWTFSGPATMTANPVTQLTDQTLGSSSVPVNTTQVNANTIDAFYSALPNVGDVYSVPSTPSITFAADAPFHTPASGTVTA
jgi:hypothetical protein